MYICCLGGDLRPCGMGQLCSKLHRVRIALLAISIQCTAKYFGQCGTQLFIMLGDADIPPRPEESFEHRAFAQWMHADQEFVRQDSEREQIHVCARLPPSLYFRRHIANTACNLDSQDAVF